MSGRGPIVQDGVLAGNYSDKYATRNPIARALVAGFRRAASDLLLLSGARDVHEVGCGEGHLTALFAEGGRRVRASDFSGEVVREARQRAAELGLDVSFKVASIHDLRPPSDAAELVACCEVLEHLEDPEGALDVLASLARPWLLASVPREPLWRVLNCARGKYLRDLGNTPGHVGHWSRAGFLAFLGRRFEVVGTRSPIPWTMALCRVREPAAARP